MKQKKRVDDWFVVNRFLLNINKTKEITFSLRQRHSLDNTTSFTFLGVCLGSKLKRNKHVEIVCIRLFNSSYAIRNLKVSDKIIMSAYFSRFRSVMFYSLDGGWGNSGQQHPECSDSKEEL